MSEWQIGSGGELVKYPDAYKDVTMGGVDEAEAKLQYIQRLEGQLETTFLRLGDVLAEFEEKKLYLARGFPTFKSWAQSDELRIGYRMAHDLIRIVRQLLPILKQYGKMEYIQSVTKMRQLLPLMGDEDGQAKFLKAIAEIKDLTVSDTKDYIRELRGIEQGNEGPAIFKAKVRYGESYHRVDVVCQDGTDYYAVGALTIKPKHYARWEERFGAFIEVVEEQRM